MSTILSKSLLATVLAVTLASPAQVDARSRHNSLLASLNEATQSQRSFEVPAQGTIEVAFSPDEGSEALVVKVLDSARSSIRMLAYSFTSVPVTQAVLRAAHRGVDVKVVVDEKENITEDRSGKARAALSSLANAGVDVRTVNVFPIHHDKTIEVDDDTVELGSFNYSAAAAHKNSENVLVNWHNPNLAKVYLGHFQRNYRLSQPFRMRY